MGTANGGGDMVIRQGDIVWLDFTPQAGHEQAGTRPAVVVSNEIFNQRTRLVIACPITNTNNTFPLHVPLDSRTKTTGVVLCEHVRALDPIARNCRIVERIPEDLLQNVLDIIFASVDAGPSHVGH